MPSRFETFPIQRVRPLRWREHDDAVELHDPVRDTWARMAPWTRETFAAIDAGEDADAILARDADEARVRRLLMSLAKVGYLRIDVPRPRPSGYEIVRELGRGGVGVAYLARRADGHELVAKRAWGFLHPLDLTQRALRREAEILQKVDSPRIVQYVDQPSSGDDVVLVRSLAHGVPLVDASPGRSLARRVADGLGDALAALHRAGFALADHKPGNLFDDGVCVTLADVGNVVPLGLQARAAGTRGFSSPEKLATPEADVHGLGRMVAYALTGRMFRKDPLIADVLEGIEGPARDALATICADDPCARPSLDEARTVLASALR